MPQLRTLRTLVAVAAVSLAMGAAACKDKPAAKAQPTAQPAPPPPPPAPEVPPECASYKAAIDRITACPALPQASRDAIRKSFDKASAAWAEIKPDGRAALATTCQKLTDAMKATLDACP